MLNAKLAVNVKHRRQENGWSLEMLAEKSDLSVRTVKKIERGDSNPTLKTLEGLAAAFSSPVEDLFR
jgi:D-alanyl-D-alanine-carboxypeptidase/D-alanyl-D-alanine-endopeptidase